MGRDPGAPSPHHTGYGGASRWYAYSVGQSGHYSSVVAIPPGPACSDSRIPPAATATTAVTSRSPRELSSPSTVILLPVRTLGIFVWGGGGGMLGDRVIEFS